MPTEAEWEYAAGGPESLEYPWGNDFDEGKLNTEKNVDHTSPVENYESGKSWVSAYDMAGNVWEWVHDWYDKEYYGQEVKDDPPGSPTGTERVMRGGAWDFHRTNCRTAYRFKAEPAYTEDNIGFRIVSNS